MNIVNLLKIETNSNCSEILDINNQLKTLRKSVKVSARLYSECLLVVLKIKNPGQFYTNLYNYLTSKKNNPLLLKLKLYQPLNISINENVNIWQEIIYIMHMFILYAYTNRFKEDCGTKTNSKKIY